MPTALKVSKYGVFSGPYSVRIRKNTDQKKPRIWTHFDATEIKILLRKKIIPSTKEELSSSHLRTTR